MIKKKKKGYSLFIWGRWSLPMAYTTYPLFSKCILMALSCLWLVLPSLLISGLTQADQACLFDPDDVVSPVMLSMFVVPPLKPEQYPSAAGTLWQQCNTV